MLSDKQIAELSGPCQVWSDEAQRFVFKEFEFARLIEAKVREATLEESAKAWAEGYHQGVEDERTSEANIGIAGFGMKVNPARQNPYALKNGEAV